MRSLLIVSALLAAVGVSADTGAAAAPSTNAPAAAPASTNEAAAAVSLPGSDLWTAALRTLHEEYGAEKKSLNEGRSQQLAAILGRCRKDADAAYDEKRRFGNIKGMMIAKTLQDFATAAAESLAKTGDFEFPGYIRHELRETFDAIRREKEKIDSDTSPRLAPLQDKVFARFKAEIGGQTGDRTPADDALRALFVSWLGEEPPALPPPASETPPGQTNGVPVAPGMDVPRVALPPDVIAQSGEAEKWETFARWTAHMSGPAAIEIPVFDQIQDQSGETQDVFSKKKSEWKMEVVKPVPGSMKYLFRLKKTADRAPVELGQWPSRENRGVLLIRAALQESYPADFGFELQGAVFSSIQTRAETEPHGRVEIQVKTEPAGARIHVDGKVFRDQGEPVKTPCAIRLPPGKTHLRLALQDFVDKDFPEFEVKAGKSLEWTFESEKDLPGKTVLAHARKIWAGTGITVKRGDRIWIIPSGQWIVGSRTDYCGPGGYPDAPQYAHYYKDPKGPPRAVADAPYGALLAKVGYLPSAKTVVVGAGRTFQVSTGGELLLDVNETAEETHRRDNRGSLDVKIIVIPASPPAK